MKRRTHDKLIRKEITQDMWYHNCPDSGPTHTARGEPCPWCDAKDPMQKLIDQQRDRRHNQWKQVGWI